MDDEAEAGRELERLRAELTEFVVDAMSQRMASGSQPELSAALAKAIDQRVDRVIEARVTDAHFPDPRQFADDVIAAARRSGGGGGAARGSGGGALRNRSINPKSFGLGFITALGITLVAWLIYSLLQRPADAQANVTAPITNGVEPTSSGPVNVIVENGAQAAPAPANLQAPAG